jgi:hypothetical protein
MLIERKPREQRLDRRPHGINHRRVECAHDVGDLATVVGFGDHPVSKPGQPNDRWMVTYPRGLSMLKRGDPRVRKWPTDHIRE